MGSKDIVKHPFITAFCENGIHPDGQPHPVCPVIIKHERTAKVWTCSCKCHTSDQIEAVANPVMSAAMNGHVVLNNDMVVSTESWERIWDPIIPLSHRLHEALTRYIGR